MNLTPGASPSGRDTREKEAESYRGMGLELWQGKEELGLESLRNGFRTAEVINSKCQAIRLQKLCVWRGGGWEKKGDTWLVGAELVFLCSGNEGSLPLCFRLSCYSLTVFFSFPGSFFLSLIPASLALLGRGRGRERRRKQLGTFPGQLGGI